MTPQIRQALLLSGQSEPPQHSPSAPLPNKFCVPIRTPTRLTGHAGRSLRLGYLIPYRSLDKPSLVAGGLPFLSRAQHRAHQLRENARTTPLRGPTSPTAVAPARWPSASGARPSRGASMGWCKSIHCTRARPDPHIRLPGGREFG